MVVRIGLSVPCDASWYHDIGASTHSSDHKRRKSLDPDPSTPLRVERAVILSRGPVLDLSDVPLPAEAAEGSPDLGTANATRAPMRFSGTVNELQHDYILHVLESAGWVVEGESGAAARLGLKPSTLRNRMNRLGIHKVSRTPPQ